MGGTGNKAFVMNALLLRDEEAGEGKEEQKGAGINMTKKVRGVRNERGT